MRQQRIIPVPGAVVAANSDEKAEIQNGPQSADCSHDEEDQSETMRSNAGVYLITTKCVKALHAMGLCPFEEDGHGRAQVGPRSHFVGFIVVELRDQHAGKEVASERIHEQEEVVQHADVLQAEQLGGRGNGDGHLDSGGDACEEGSQVER